VGRVRDSSIEALRERADLCDVASSYVSLRRSGAYLRGLSPFNAEKTPSFFIHPERRYFHCYSSGHAGDVFTLVQLKEGMTFREAVEFLAEKYHFPLEYESGHDAGEDGISKTTLLAIQNHADRLFRENFFAPTAEGHAARRYWTEKRHFSLEAAERYAIGLAPMNSSGLCQNLLRHYPEEALAAAGICHRSPPHALHCRFRGRLTIPIRDASDRIVAFSGRILQPIADVAKYINSPETGIFRKGSLLFGLHRARKELGEDGAFLLTEGPLDCLRCWECGLGTAIAAQGTAITAQHLAILRRHGQRLDCLLDGDRAGDRAALHLVPLALRAGLELRLLRLPAGQDPDLFFEREGKDALGTLPVQGVAEFLVATHLASPARRSAERKREGLRRVLEGVAAADSPALERELLHQISLLAAIPLDVLLREYRSPEREPEKAAPAVPAGTAPFCAADGLLAFYVLHPHWRQSLAEQIPPEWLGVESRSERILNHLIGELQNGVPWDRALAELEEEDRFHALALSAAMPAAAPGDDGAAVASIDAAGQAVEFLRSLHGNFVRRELDGLRGQLDNDAIRQRKKLREELRSPPNFYLPGEREDSAV
jgi:DNA primase